MINASTLKFGDLIALMYLDHDSQKWIERPLLFLSKRRDPYHKGRYVYDCLDHRFVIQSSLLAWQVKRGRMLCRFSRVKG